MTYKIPFRQIYCSTFTYWIKEIIWCFIIKLFPGVIDLQSDTLKYSYLNNPKLFYEQYEWKILETNSLKHLDIT